MELVSLISGFILGLMSLEYKRLLVLLQIMITIIITGFVIKSTNTNVYIWESIDCYNFKNVIIFFRDYGIQAIILFLFIYSIFYYFLYFFWERSLNKLTVKIMSKISKRQMILFKRSSMKLFIMHEKFKLRGSRNIDDYSKNTIERYISIYLQFIVALWMVNNIFNIRIPVLFLTVTTLIAFNMIIKYFFLLKFILNNKIKNNFYIKFYKQTIHEFNRDTGEVFD